MQIEPNEKDEYIEKNFFSKEIPIEERTAVFNKLFFHYKKDWQSSFAFMLILSVGIASLGLSGNSTATIIGAMIIAPLGQPIVALGGAIAQGWRIQSLRMFGIILIGALGALGVAYLISLTLPNLTPSDQILIRTSPDLRDLGIALMAGAAGAYGYYRSEYSTVLAGFAIAVALVPPLCACGLMLEQNHFILASGSMLLFITNLIGVTISALLVFFVLGFKHKSNRRLFNTGSFLIMIIGIIIIFPLALNYDKFSAGAQFQSAIFKKAGDICTHSKNSPVIKNISIQGNAAIITIEPFPNNKLDEENLITRLEEATKLQVFLK